MASTVVALVVLGVALSGCYLGHLAVGQAQVLRARRPLAEVLADPETPDDVRASLAIVEEARQYADALGLDVGDQYTSYVAWPGDRIVTTLVATEPGQVEPAGFWFPIAGRVPYKGYFDQARAEAAADELRSQGLDVCVSAVPAYSTLGWLDDPVTTPMLRGGEGRLAETLLHELVHATVYVPDHSDFNEGVASFIGQEASVRLFAESDRDAARRRDEIADARQLAAARLALREEVRALYEREPAGPERDAERAALEARAREAVRRTPLAIRDPAAIAEALRLNDACLALAGTYSASLPDYDRTLAGLGGDLGAFVARVREAAEAPDPGTALLGDAPPEE